MISVLQYVGKNPTTQQINSIWASSSGEFWLFLFSLIY